MTTPGGRSFNDGGVDHVLQDILTRLGKLERANRLTGASIGSGGLTVKDGGAINVEDALGAIQVILDSDGLDVGSGLVVVDDAGVNINSGLVIMDADGIDINTGLVVLDNTGLHVDGGLVRAMDSATAGVNGTAFTLGTAWNNWGTITITVPSWADRLHVLGAYRSRVTASSGTPILSVGTTVDDASAPAGASSFIHLAASESRVLTEPFRANVASPGATVVLRFWAQLNAGSTTNHSFVANVQWLALKD